MYQAGFEREEAQSSFTCPTEEFLRSLDLRMRIERATDEQLLRAEELTLRTSQMNATGVHYSDATLRGLLADPHHEILVASLTDRFGPHGAIGVMLPATHPGVWSLKVLATSCRVVSFGAGAAIVNGPPTRRRAPERTWSRTSGRPTRNQMVEIAYRFAGFGDESCDCLAVLPETDVDGLRRLHLAADRRQPHATIDLTAPDLSADRMAPTDGRAAADVRAASAPA